MLTLPIKRKWFAMIAAGEKLEEYRADTPYYKVRFEKALKHAPYITVCFRNGYRADSPKITCVVRPTLRYGARKEWGGDPAVLCWVLEIKEVKA